MPSRLAPAFGVAILSVAAWLFVVGALAVSGTRVSEDTAFVFGIGIFAASWLGAALIVKRRAPSSDDD